MAGFEAELCKDLGLVRKKVLQTERRGFRMSSPMSSMPNLDSEMKIRDQVRLPQINEQARHVSQANLKDMRIQSRYGVTGSAKGEGRF